MAATLPRMNPCSDQASAVLPTERVNGRFAPGTSGNPAGRPRGLPNNLTRLRDAILEAATLEGGGGRDGLVNFLRELSRSEPVAFAGLLSRCLPPLRPERQEDDLPLVLIKDFTGASEQVKESWRREAEEQHDSRPVHIFAMGPGRRSGPDAKDAEGRSGLAPEAVPGELPEHHPIRSQLASPRPPGEQIARQKQARG